MMTHSLPAPYSPGEGDNDDEDLICPVCQDEFKEPKFLPCHHYYCKDCIQQLVTRAGPRTPISCPECRTLTQVPNDDVNQLLPAFFVNKLLDKKRKEKLKMTSSLPSVPRNHANIEMLTGSHPSPITEQRKGTLTDSHPSPITEQRKGTLTDSHPSPITEQTKGTLTGSHPSPITEQTCGNVWHAILNCII